MSGMTAQVFFVTGQAQDVASVPLSALAEDGTLRILGPDGPETRTPTVGLRTRSHPEVAGIDEGVEVIIGERVEIARSPLSIVP